MNDDTHVRERPSEDRAEGPPRVIIVDDNPSYAQGLATLLTKIGDVDVLSLAFDPEEALQATQAHRPDLILMDLRLSDHNGIETIRSIRSSFPEVKVVVLTASTEASDVRNAMTAGACGYLLKQSDAGDLLEGIRAVHAGDIVVKPALLDPAPEPLTEHEVRLLKLLAKGLELSSIARELGVSESTVKRQVVQVQRKLRVENRIQAVVAAATRGLL